MKKPANTSSNIVLGAYIERLRLRKDVPRKELGKRLKVTEKQIGLYEAGAFLSLAKIEAVGEYLDCPVQKRIIRRISSARKLEVEKNVDKQEELIALYDEAFANDD